MLLAARHADYLMTTSDVGIEFSLLGRCGKANPYVASHRGRCTTRGCGGAGHAHRQGAGACAGAGVRFERLQPPERELG